MQSFNVGLIGLENVGKTSFIKNIPYINKKQKIYIISEKSDKTNSETYFNHHFLFKYDNINAFSFYVNDYSGDIFKSKEKKSYKILENDIKKSDFIIMMIDGDLLTGDKKTSVRNIQRKCSRFCSPIVSNCDSDTFNSILFVITKYDKINKSLTKKDITEIIKESFGGIFNVQHKILCIETDTKNNISVPIFVVIKYFLAELFNDTRASQANLLKIPEKLIDLHKIKKVREFFHKFFLKEIYKNKKLLIYGFDNYLTEYKQYIIKLITMILSIILFIILFIFNSIFRKIVIGAVILLIIAIIISSFFNKKEKN